MHKLYLFTTPIQCSILTLLRSSKSTKRYHISNRSTKEPEPIKAEPHRANRTSTTHHQTESCSLKHQATISSFNPKRKCTAIFKFTLENLKTLQTKAQTTRSAATSTLQTKHNAKARIRPNSWQLRKHTTRTLTQAVATANKHVTM